MTETKSQLYIPKGCKFISESEDSQIRLGIQGEPFSGKTTAALTFPNPVILSFDRKVSAHINRSDVPLVPFYNPAFVDSVVRRDGQSCPPNKKDALLKWLRDEGVKLVEEQTLIIDGCSGIETSYHIWFRQHEIELASTKRGSIDSYVEWNLKLVFFEELWDAFKALQCGVIFISHEQKDRNKEGELNGKIKPLLTGQVADKIGKEFTDWVRQVCISKPQTDDQKKEVMEHCGVDKTTLLSWIDATPKAYGSIHLWKVQGDSYFSGGASSLLNVPKYILANYETFAKYRRNNKQQITT